MTTIQIIKQNGNLNHKFTIKKSYVKTKGWKKHQLLKYVKISDGRYKLVEGTTTDYSLQELRKPDGRTYYRLTLSPFIINEEGITNTSKIFQIENNDGELELRFTK